MRQAIVVRPGSSVQLPARTSRAVARQHYRGVEASARVRASAYVAHVGMALTAQLSTEEAILIQQSPLADPRLKVIVDQFVLVVASEVAGIGL